VRELRNVIEYALNICEEDVIQPRHLPAYLTDPKAHDWEREERKQGSSSPLGEELGEKEAEIHWSAVERKMIMEALIKARGRRTKAASLLGWGRSTLWRKMKQYEMDSR
jgi:DNA-binding NtrC family response regulator